jgi:hypothetical protein
MALFWAANDSLYWEFQAGEFRWHTLFSIRTKEKNAGAALCMTECFERLYIWQSLEKSLILLKIWSCLFSELQ